MKKISFFFVAASLISFVSCNRESLQEVNGEKEQNSEIKTEVIGASLNENDTKATVASGGTFNWTTSDYVAFYNGSTYVKSAAASTAGISTSFAISYSGERSAYAYYPYYLVQETSTDVNGESMLSALGSSTNKVVLPSQYTLGAVSAETTPCPMIADNTGSGWTFKQLCGLLRLTINSIPSTATYLKVDFNGQKVHGVFEVSNPGGEEPKISTESNNSNDVITITGLSEVTSAVINLPLPDGAGYGNITIVAYNSSDVPLMASHTSVKADGTVYSATRAKCKPRTTTLNMGIFSIAAGKYAIIAPGNLQYQASTNKWKFADQQYSYIGTANNNIAVDYDGWIDLFGWGTSGWNSGANEYQPYSTSTNNSDYYPGGSTTSSLTGAYAQADWGIYNEIGMDPAGTWRTLTNDQTYYFLFSRPATATVNGTNKARFTLAKINTDGTAVNGLICFPDNYSGGTPSGVTWGNINKESPWGTRCTVAGWTSLASAGCVFFPAAGTRTGKSSSVVNVSGQYFTTTGLSENYVMHFTFYGDLTETGRIAAGEVTSRATAHSVRLFHDL